jgi:hypothetical protein
MLSRYLARRRMRWAVRRLASLAPVLDHMSWEERTTIRNRWRVGRGLPWLSSAHE